jgi:hypothetical protein
VAVVTLPVMWAPFNASTVTTRRHFKCPFLSFSSIFFYFIFKTTFGLGSQTGWFYSRIAQVKKVGNEEEIKLFKM